jgi:hypothetical protein
MSGGITVRQEAARSSSGFFLFTDSVRESFALIGGRRSRGNGLEQRGQRMRKETNWLTSLLVAGLFQIQISAAVATPPDAEFVTAKQSFLKAMKKKSTEARVAAVDRFAELARPETADFLIDLLLKTEGLIQHDVIQYLTRLTSQKFRNHDQEWKIWWTENRSEFDFPPLGDVLPEVIQGEQIRTDYGIPICAKRMVFVLDTSDSMRGQPIERAKQDDVST